MRPATIGPDEEEEFLDAAVLGPIPIDALMDLEEYQDRRGRLWTWVFGEVLGVDGQPTQPNLPLLLRP